VCAKIKKIIPAPKGNKFIIRLYTFRALLCSLSGGHNCIIQRLVSSHWYKWVVWNS